MYNDILLGQYENNATHRQPHLRTELMPSYRRAATDLDLQHENLTNSNGS